ncbi:hypothetical protein EVAR_14131_1 [Eumeta japonica]|uniref:Uncharacterized protein n=1 Tax=Eumeta variegata TaxID=151549 RepID=A0A4C1UEJ5_EUMVA|nr:hypothetical protein EVAR_14131_1 [Eumeta japonica]
MVVLRWCLSGEALLQTCYVTPSGLFCRPSRPCGNRMDSFIELRSIELHRTIHNSDPQSDLAPDTDQAVCIQLLMRDRVLNIQAAKQTSTFLYQLTLPSVGCLIPTLRIGKSSVTPLRLLVFMGDDDNPLSGGSHARSPLENVIKKSHNILN